MEHHTFLHLCLSLLLSLTQASWPHIYSGEHFYDVMGTPIDWHVAGRSGVLVLYSPECEGDLHSHQLNLDSHFMYLTHDYVRVKQHTWYKLTEDDDLHRKYAKPGTPCLSAYYFKKGVSLDAPSEEWSAESGSLRTWVWGLQRRMVTVVNDSPQTIVVTQEATKHNIENPEVAPNHFIRPGRSEDIETYVSYMLTVVDEEDKQMFYAGLVGEDPEVNITIKELEPVDLRGIRADGDEESNFWSRWMWAHASRHLLNIKEPLIVPNFTAIGYKQMAIPADLYAAIKTFYDDNKKDRIIETTMRSLVRSQAENMQSTLVHLPQSILNQMELTIRPMLEMWCRCELKFTFIYGIREYYYGNILHHHLDWLETHVVSAIFQIDQDLGAKQEDWLLEVIDYNGDRKQVKLMPGEMLMYESTRLIHGRPQAFRGNIFANVFIHFTPVSGWDYEIVDDGDELVIRSTSREIREPLADLYTDLTARKKVFRVKQEL